MLAGLEMVFELSRPSCAVAAFTCYDTTTAIAVVEEAQRLSVPVILLVSVASAAEGDAGRLLIRALHAIAEQASVAVCIQLDHARDPGTAEQALRAGASAVMIDGSRLGFAENVRLTRTVVDLARTWSAEVEAELGHVAGAEDVAAASEPGSLTDPAEAADFVASTGVNCLAVSVGNVHGVYASPPALEFDRIEAIRHVVRIPLALHGASGVPDEQVRRSVACGIRKVSVNTEIRACVFRELQAAGEYADGFQMLGLNAAVRSAIADCAGQKLALLGSVEGAAQCPDPSARPHRHRRP